MIDALGRRVSESSSGVVSSSHYSDGSDNPAWVTQTGGVDVVSEIYTASLGSGLRVFTKEVSGLVSASVQLSDVRGNTVTGFDLGSKTVSGWSSFDAFGNAEGVVSKSGLLGYGAYGQMQRATTSSGLMLMGVRVYNPVTNQFSSVDAVSGGNESPYGYPNYPVNKNDFSGLLGWFEAAGLAVGMVIAVGAASLFCGVTLGAGCLLALVVSGAVGGVVQGVGHVADKKQTGARAQKTVADYAIAGAIAGPMKLPAWKQLAKIPGYRPSSGKLSLPKAATKAVLSAATSGSVGVTIHYAQHARNRWADAR